MIEVPLRPSSLATLGRRALARLLLVAGLAAGLPAAAAGVPTIGAIVPQSWPVAGQGEEIIRGMQLAIKTWPGRPAPKLVVKDGACNAQRSEAAMAELLAAKVDIVLGSWCVIGRLPALASQARVPYVSAHAERLGSPPAGVIQLGRVPLYEAERIAEALRAKTGLRISARTSCWMNFEPVLWDQYDALLCPVLGADKARWDQAAATYGAVHRQPFTQSAARGYAAMEVALAQLRRRASGARGEVEAGLETVLGPLPAADAPATPQTMQLVFADRLPRLRPREQAALDTLIATKDCGCAGDPACAAKGGWGEQPFEVRGRSARCPVVQTGLAR